MTGGHLSIYIRTVEHSDQRYDTAGDWRDVSFVYDGRLHSVRLLIDVSRTGDWRHAALVAVHELVEALLCRHRGIEQHVVDAFDLANPLSGDPGDEPDCPYRDEHRAAETIERQLAAALDVPWEDYCDALGALDYDPTSA
jgi:hypothetical protein